ncbi:hypothetical protein QLX67_12055, partial [Balneolaceae bacterium ANBcel3]|nr:hypothetical protein [Balneolaceae bacterium ANBcel3]
AGGHEAAQKPPVYFCQKQFKRAGTIFIVPAFFLYGSKSQGYLEKNDRVAVSDCDINNLILLRSMGGSIYK